MGARLHAGESEYEFLHMHTRNRHETTHMTTLSINEKARIKKFMELKCTPLPPCATLASRWDRGQVPGRAAGWYLSLRSLGQARRQRRRLSIFETRQGIRDDVGDHGDVHSLVWDIQPRPQLQSDLSSDGNIDLATRRAIDEKV